MYGIIDDDYIMGIALGLFFSFKKDVKITNFKKPIDKNERSIFERIKEQAEDVEYEEVHC